ncbi:MAG: glycosyltransferase family 4 protein [Acidobacteriota bacterium]|nr:glycosyltransferase family 4 protein [Acidobacteriota bacterium]
MRLMFHSVPPWVPTGYGQQMKQILQMTAALGHQAAVVCYTGLTGGILEHEGVRYYPALADKMGEDALMLHAWHFQPHAAFTFTDIWTLQLDAVKRFAKLGLRWVPITPIDHEPAPARVLARLHEAYHAITFAPYGHRELDRLGIDNTYIPHTVDAGIFYKRDKAECRRFLEIPEDIFLFGMVAANGTNPPRKGFQHVLDAFKRFHDKHPKSGLYIHTHFEREGGFDIDGYARYLGIADALYTMDDYQMMMLADWDVMARVYSAFDAKLLPSENEGFGVPIIEAMACEVPVIATDFTAMRDLVEDGVTGYQLKLRGKRFTNQGAYVADPDPDHLYECMKRIFSADRAAMGRRGREFVLRDHDLTTVQNRYWRPFLERLAEKFRNESEAPEDP